MIIGVDLGNYAPKTSERISFLGKISEEENFSGENEVVYNGKKLYIGEGEFSTDWNKSTKENTLPMLFTALAMSSTESYFQVVLGLPIQQYKTNKEKLIDYIEKNRAVNIILNGIKRDIVITDVQVVPEGASAYYNLDYEIKKRIGKRQLVIVDIGGRTTDVCLFQDKKIKGYKTIPVGMLDVYKDIVNKINDIYTKNFNLEFGEEVLKDGLFLYGEQQDISFIQPILKKHFSSIFKELQINFELDSGYVYLTGGGALTFKKAFQNRLKNLIISNDPIFDNVMGFKKVGEQLWQGR